MSNMWQLLRTSAAHGWLFISQMYLSIVVHVDSMLHVLVFHITGLDPLFFLLWPMCICCVPRILVACGMFECHNDIWQGHERKCCNNVTYIWWWCCWQVQHWAVESMDLTKSWPVELSRVVELIGLSQKENVELIGVAWRWNFWSMNFRSCTELIAVAWSYHFTVGVYLQQPLFKWAPPLQEK